MIGSLFRYEYRVGADEQLELFEDESPPPDSPVLLVQAYDNFCSLVLSHSGMHVVLTKYLRLCQESQEKET